MPVYDYSKSVMRTICSEVFIGAIGLGRGGGEKEMEVGILIMLLSAGGREGKNSVERDIMQV